MIGATNREGALGPDAGTPVRERHFWEDLDRRLPLRLKVVLTVVAVAVLGSLAQLFLFTQRPSGGMLSVIAIGLGVAAIETLVLTVALEYGMVRRVRRIHARVSGLGQDALREHLPEGAMPPGRDALFNLAREVDLKLRELDHRERAGAVVTDLGMLSTQGASQAELTTRALVLTRNAADLDECLLVDRSGPTIVVSDAAASAAKVLEGELPIWLGALARSAAHARRPVLAGRLGVDSAYWDGQSEPTAATAAFVPMPGIAGMNPVMIGLVHAGDQVTSSTVALMEGVVTALSESIERGEATRARQESADKSKALATVSHEMRNPLNAMIGFSELLLDGSGGALNERQRLYVQQVNDASHHLLSLVNDYLDLTRVMVGSLPLQIEAVDVGAEVTSVIEMMRPTADTKQVSLHSSVDVDGAARADRVRLRQVLVNLVANAIRSTPAHGHVRVEVAGGSNGVRISVIDTGVGVPADRQHLVFVEFADLHPGEASDGRGLGLALSKHFVEAMGGFIRFTSAEGAGAIFDVWLPGENSPPATEETT